MNTSESIIVTELVGPSSTTAPLLSVIVPAFNEAATIGAALDALHVEPTSKEIIIVDDGSTDQTPSQIEYWLQSISSNQQPSLRLVAIRQPINRGKGTAIRIGLDHAQGTYVVVQDADLEVDPASFATLLAPLLQRTKPTSVAVGAQPTPPIEIVIGRRRHLSLNQRWFFATGIGILNLAVRILYRYPVHDAACCYKVLSRKNLQAMRLSCERFEFCPEVIAKASRMGLGLAEVDIDYTPRTVEQGKKLRLVYDGWMALATLWRYRHWNPNSPSAAKSNSATVR